MDTTVSKQEIKLPLESEMSFGASTAVALANRISEFCQSVLVNGIDGNLVVYIGNTPSIDGLFFAWLVKKGYRLVLEPNDTPLAVGETPNGLSQKYLADLGYRTGLYTISW